MLRLAILAGACILVMDQNIAQNKNRSQVIEYDTVRDSSDNFWQSISFPKAAIAINFVLIKANRAMEQRFQKPAIFALNPLIPNPSLKSDSFQSNNSADQELDIENPSYSGR